MKESFYIRLYNKLTGMGVEGWFTIIDGKPPRQLLELMKIYDGIKILNK